MVRLPGLYQRLLSGGGNVKDEAYAYADIEDAQMQHRKVVRRARAKFYGTSPAAARFEISCGSGSAPLAAARTHNVVGGRSYYLIPSRVATSS